MAKGCSCSRALGSSWGLYTCCSSRWVCRLHREQIKHRICNLFARRQVLAILQILRLRLYSQFSFKSWLVKVREWFWQWQKKKAFSMVRFMKLNHLVWIDLHSLHFCFTTFIWNYIWVSILSGRWRILSTYFLSCNYYLAKNSLIWVKIYIFVP